MGNEAEVTADKVKKNSKKKSEMKVKEVDSEKEDH